MAARKFLDTVGPHLAEHSNDAIWNWHGTPEWTLNQALGELRGVFGVHVALLAERYSLAIEPDLASILPADQDDDGEDWFFNKFPQD